MTQLIDKDKLVAEIRKRLLPVVRDKHYDEWEEGQDSERKAILGIIDTLEVKEVDLAKEIDKFYGMYRKNGITFSIEDNQECLDWKEDCNPDFEIGFARHFFELGFKVAQKGE